MQRLGVERRLQGGDFVEEDSERPDIRFEVVALTLDDFGRQVVGGADDSLGLGAGVREHSGDTEVSQLDHALLRDEDVL